MKTYRYVYLITGDKMCKYDIIEKIKSKERFLHFYEEMNDEKNVERLEKELDVLNRRLYNYLAY